ncbi:MAG: hypothetical protein M1814_004579 [Vezdaea aestivalis]|nr:MAG: hypothetical protein M1814_004579 [Vezdaea aestivalis]
MSCLPRATSTFLLFALFLHTAFCLTVPYQPPPKDVLDAERIEPNEQGQALRAADIQGSQISRNGWTVSTDSYQPVNEPEKTLDGNTITIWHSRYSPSNAALPHTITFDMKSSYNVNGFTYLPRQDGNRNGNIGRHQIFLSTDGTNFGSPVAYGTFIDDSTQKNIAFEPVPARYLRIVALTEAGNRGPWTSAAEINIFAAPSYTAPVNGRGRWGPTINFDLVPVAASVQYNTGKVVAWSSFARDTFSGGNGQMTITSTWDPSTGVVTSRTITNTLHDMFCPGISMDASGRTVVTGGNNAPKTSIYDPAPDGWISGANMKIPRGYQSSVTCSDGRIFTIGGSWSGGEGNKNGEIYSPSANTWTLLPSCPVAPMLTADAQGVYRADNHAWLFGWKGGSVFQAGPSKAMNWYGTSGSGSQSGAGNRAGSADAMCGNAIMYDAVSGRILSAGGAPNYQNIAATNAAHLITINNAGQAATVETLASMANARIFANAVVLPDGKVFVAGGQTYGSPFSDANSIFVPELWNPATKQWSPMNPNSTPRTYHSIALLLLDGTVLVGGGGLCATCSTNHFDAQIFRPPYLFNSDGSVASRPVINSLSTATVVAGNTLTINTNTGISSVSLVRFSSATHSVNTDQRRIPLTPTVVGTNSYRVTIPSDTGISTPGYWMVFVLNSAGVPSAAKTLKITG